MSTNIDLTNPGHIIGLLFATFFIELITSFFFNLRIRNLTASNWKMGAIYSGMSNFLFVLTILFNSFVGAEGNQIWYIFASSFFAAMGNFTSVFVVRHYEKYQIFFKPFKIMKLTNDEISFKRKLVNDNRIKIKELEDKITFITLFEFEEKWFWNIGLL